MLQPQDAQTVRRPTGRCLVAALSALFLLGACGSGSDSADAGGGAAPVVVATTSIWADVLANVACGDLVTIQTLVPVGGDPHSFEPSLADRGRLGDAALIVANGLSLEEGLETTIATVESEGVPVFRIADEVETIDFSGGNGSESGANTENQDPHVWFDPVRVAAVLPAFGDLLIKTADLDPAAVADCVGGYQAELAAIDSEIEELVATVPETRRSLVTNHDALGYFADRYGFEIIGTVIPTSSGLAETNPAQLEALAQLVHTVGVPAVFAESQHATDDADALARRVGDLEVVTLRTGTLGEPGGDSATYVEFLRTNAMLITGALR